MAVCGGEGSLHTRTGDVHAMPLYDLMYIVKPYVRRRELADILMRTGRYVFAQGGVVTKVESFGSRELAYDFKVQGETFEEVRWKIGAGGY
jgi:ribosomal protein S6